MKIRSGVSGLSCALLQLAATAWSAAQEQNPVPLVPGAAPARSCESLRELSLPDTQITEARSVPGEGNAPAWCQVTAVVSYPASGDRFTVWVGLPMTQWNGRFQGLGGGGFMVGNPMSLAPQVASGYAAAATDGGIQRGGADRATPATPATPANADGSFALDAQGHLNWSQIRDFAHRGIHEMTVTGKALTQAFYGHAAPKSYFNGCSTGGRQGQMEAQRYPADYDGILSGAPAVNWSKLHIAQLWGQLAMLQAKDVVAPCKLAAATAAAVAACDTLDGVQDGIISAPRRCTYDPKPLIGTSAGSCGVISASDAEVIRKIWQGPRRQDGSFLWYGEQRGADLAALNGPNVFAVTLDWWRLFIKQDPKWDWHSLTPDMYEQVWDQSVEEYTVIATDDVDLEAFHHHGGKMLLWHGEADQLIYPQGTIDYFERIQKRSGGAKVADDFVRLFMAPGVGHCTGGNGPQPTRQLDALVNWVEHGKAPATILAVSVDKQQNVTRSRPLCPYPSVATYLGHGSSDEAQNFKCAAPPAESR